MPLRKYIVLFLTSSLIVGCSTTSGLREGEQLYAGLEKIEYSNYERNQHFISTQEEIEAALAAAPTGAFFGSSYGGCGYGMPLRVKPADWQSG